MATSKSEYVKRTKVKRHEFIIAHKAETGCAHCGERHPACLDLHHRNSEDKNPKLTKIKSTGRYHTGGSKWIDLSFAEIEAEINKCDVLCSNCHRKETAKQLGWRTANHS